MGNIFKEQQLIYLLTIKKPPCYSELDEEGRLFLVITLFYSTTTIRCVYRLLSVRMLIK
jgi:hypothetical protein